MGFASSCFIIIVVMNHRHRRKILDGLILFPKMKDAPILSSDINQRAQCIERRTDVLYVLYTKNKKKRQDDLAQVRVNHELRE